MTESLINSLVIAAFTVILGAVVAFFVRINARKQAELKQLREDIEELKRSMATVNTQMSPLWARVQAQIAQDLHHPNPRYAEMDALLEQLDSLKITTDERARLKILLVERSKDLHVDISQEQREKAAFMVTVMDMVLAEKAVADAADSAVQRIATIEGAVPIEVVKS
jgi:hypothetical protein